jgi:hypothetical protein
MYECVRRGREELRFLLRYCDVTFMEGLGEVNRKLRITGPRTEI